MVFGQTPPSPWLVQKTKFVKGNISGAPLSREQKKAELREMKMQFIVERIKIGAIGLIFSGKKGDPPFSSSIKHPVGR